MITRAPHRRATIRFTAAILGCLLTASACADSPTTATAPTTTVDQTSIPDDHGLSASLAATVIESTFALSGVACGRTSSGSGFAVSEDLVATSAHVILGMDSITVHAMDGAEYPATPVGFDADNDLALLRVTDGSFTPLARSDNAPAGSIGMLVGWESAPFPDPSPYRINRPVTVRIQPVGGTEPVERPAYLLAASIDAGDSGAALVNVDGEVVGVVFATSIEVDGIGYAVRSAAVDDLLARGLDPNLTIPAC